MKGAGFSLWVVPEGDVRDRLAALIAALARRFGGPPFEPHVTLLGGLPLPAPDVLKRTRDLVRGQPRIEVRFTGPEAGESYFRCLYLRAEPGPELASLHARAREAFDRRNEPSFFPHLSLFYGTPPAPSVVEELRASMPAGFEARHVDVYSTEGEVESWHRVGRVPLA